MAQGWSHGLVGAVVAAWPATSLGCQSDEPAAIPALVAAGLGAALLPAASRRHSPRHAVA
jgi:uncharacterized membrane protein YeaQ/YmgE (transglycosylase-associated protein family)